jgi:hypothetical protein
MDMTIKDPKQQIKKTGMDELLKQPQNTAPTATADMSQQVAEAIKQAGQKSNEEKLQTVRESTEKTAKQLREEADAFQVGESAVMQQPEDGLQRMIQEAKLQTDMLGQGSAMIGADPDLQGAGQKLRQVTAGLPAADVEEQEWVDNSYLTPQSELKEQGQQMQGAWVDPRAGSYMQIKQPDGSFVQDPMMYMRDGTAKSTEGKTEEEIREMIRQAQDDTFALTGRVYRPNADGTVPQWLSVGDQVVTAGGTYVITGHDREKGGYHSKLLDANQTTDNYQGNYNTGTYGSIIGERNQFNDAFKGVRDSGGEFTGYGGYSQNPNGKTQFDTVSHTFDGEWTRSAIVDGVPYELDARGNLQPMEAGSLVQDASGRYWVVGADGGVIDVTPEDPRNNPLNDPTGMVGRIQREEAEKAGLDLDRKRKAEQEAEKQLDPATQAKIEQLQMQLERQKSAAEAANRDLYRQYRLGQERLEDQLVGAGLNTSGVSEKVQAQLTADYLSGMNQNRQQTRTAEEDAAYQIEMAQLMALQEAEAQRKAEAQQKAATLAQYGDFSGYGELGYTPAQIAGMKQAYDAENAPDTGYKGLSDYAQTLLGLYQANPGYDIKRGLQQALDGGLISQQDYIAALQTAAGMAV